MSFNTKLAQLASKLNFGALLRQKIDAPVNNVLVADSANAVGSYTQTTMEKAILDPLRSHIANKNNPHNLDAYTVGTYTKAETDAIVDELLHGGDLPVSRFGSLNYLPINVTGGVEAMADVGRDTTYPMAIERDGTLVYLRLATEGNVRDLYYAYVEDAMDSALSNGAIPTVRYSTRRYRPAFFPQGYTVREMYQGNEGVLGGVAVHDTLGDISFLSVTQNTLDDSQHTLFFFDEAVVRGTGPRRGVSFFRVNKPSLGGDYIYCIRGNYDFSGGSDTFVVYRASLAGLGAGDFLTFSQVTNWSVTNILGNVTTGQSTLSFYTNFSSTASAGVVIQQSPNIVEFRPHRSEGASLVPVVSPLNNKVRVLLGTSFYAATNAPAGATRDIGLVFELDLLAKTADILDKSGPLYIDKVTSGTGVLALSGNLNYGGILSILAPNGQTSGTAVSAANVIYTMRVTFSNFQPILRRVNITNSSKTFYDLLGDPTEPNTYRSVTPNRRFFGPLGPSLRAMFYLNSNFAAVSCLGYDSNGVYSGTDNYTVFRNNINDTSYSYHSDNYQIKQNGTTPLNPRRRTYEDGVDQSEMAKMVQVVKYGGNVSVRGGWLMQGIKNNIPKTLSVNSSTGAVTFSSNRLVIADSVMAPAATAIFSIEGIAPLVSSYKTEVFYPDPGWNTAGHVKGFILLTVVTTTNQLRFYIYQVSFNSNTVAGSTTITGINIVTKIGDSIASTTAAGTPPFANQIRTGAIMAMEYLEGWVIAGQSGFITQISGATVGAYFVMTVSKDSIGSTPNILRLNQRRNYTSTPTYLAHPTLGFGLAYSDISPYSDSETKILFNPVAKNWSELVNSYSESRYSPQVDGVVIASIIPPAAWTFTFPEEMPVVISGKGYVLPVTAFDLMDYDSSPANKSFYLYVELNEEGQAEYVIKNAGAPDTIESIYIGRVTTGSDTISELQIEKVTKLAEYRLSTTPRGLSIPVSPGNPHSPSAIDTNWF